MSNQHNTHNANHGTLKSYVIGFILSIALTVIPYMAVVSHSMTLEMTALIVVGVGIIQLLVQLIFFLHLNTKADGRDNLMAFIFTFLIIAILVCGSLWIMYSMNYNMMDH
jgi:cytochrome o ubiquinol oxidase subunit IV